MNLSLFLALIFIITFSFGRLLEKIRVPWIFAALFLGLLLSFDSHFTVLSNSSTFEFLAQLGMYFLLFIIGFDLNLKEISKQKKIVAKISTFIILTETLLGALLIHYVFKISWGISILVATSFSTVGEAILIPILDEFKLTKTKVGQSILGIGTVDDVVELMTIIAVALLLGERNDKTLTSFFINIFYMAVLFTIPFLISLIHKKIHNFKFKNVPSLFLFSMFMIFLLVGIGAYVESAALGAILAGITLKLFLDKKQSAYIESTVRTVSYGLFVPIFFVWVGQSINMKYIIQGPLIVLAILLITTLAKVLTTYLLGKKTYGKKESILMGIGLSAKFSTSIVILSLLLYKNIIPLSLYSTLLGAMTISQFIIPILFSYLSKKWAPSFNKN